jgi:hypothetical protein
MNGRKQKHFIQHTSLIEMFTIKYNIINATKGNNRCAAAAFGCKSRDEPGSIATRWRVLQPEPSISL